MTEQLTLFARGMGDFIPLDPPKKPKKRGRPPMYKTPPYFYRDAISGLIADRRALAATEARLAAEQASRAAQIERLETELMALRDQLATAETTLRTIRQQKRANLSEQLDLTQEARRLGIRDWLIDAGAPHDDAPHDDA